MVGGHFLGRREHWRRRAIGGLVVVLAAAGLVTAAAAPPAAADDVGAVTEFSLPSSTATVTALTGGPDGNVWFTEQNDNKVGKVTPAGSITEYPLPTPDAGPSAITLGSDGNLWFTEQHIGKIGRITPSGTITEFATPSSGTSPTAIVSGPEGKLWFLEFGTLAAMNTDGVVTDEFPVVQFPNSIWSLAVGPDGNLWIPNGAYTYRVTPAGTITQFETGGPLRYYGLAAAGADGNLWLTESEGGSFEKVATDGTVLQTYWVGILDLAPQSLLMGPDNRVWFAQAPTAKVGAIDTSGAVTTYSMPSGKATIGMAAGPDGNMWTGEPGGIAKIGTGPPPPPPSPLGDYHPITPARILDTRTATGGHQAPLGPAGSLTQQVTGNGGVPAAGVEAVVVNATVTNTTAPSFLTLWPGGETRPLASNLNWVPGQTVPNLVTVAVGASGGVGVYNNAGTTDVVLDVVGYYASPTGDFGSRFHALSPWRDFDTRDGSGGVPAAKLVSGQVLKFNVTGLYGVPANATGVVLNLTVTEPTSSGFVTVYPDGVATPVASNLNFVAGATTPNLVVVAVPPSGIVDFYHFATAGGSTHLLADVVGYYDDDRSNQAGRFVPTSPTRLYDTRVGSQQLPASCISGGAFLGLSITNPAIDSLMMNVTATQPTAAGYVTVWPLLTPLPLSSNLNFVPGQTVPNLVAAKVGPDQAIGFYNNAGCTHLVIDAGGFFTSSSAPAPGASAAGAGASTAGSDPYGVVMAATADLPAG